VQVLLSSSYTGFGHTSLKTDAVELGRLVTFLQEEMGSLAVGLVGHSTGTQDSVYYVKTCEDPSKKPVFIVLQAPVSDREHLCLNETTSKFVQLAREMRAQGKGEEMLPRAAMWAPITADRFLDLATKEGLDDFFSSDLSDGELRDRLGHLDIPTLFLLSGADEYVPLGVNVQTLGERFVKACAGACPLPRAATVVGARHSGRGHEEVITLTILAFLDEVDNLIC
jgi:pimeloyl-ACP methyl ester carboxylesterase